MAYEVLERLLRADRTFPPAFRASDNPIALACLRFRTGFPELPFFLPLEFMHNFPYFPGGLGVRFQHRIYSINVVVATRANTRERR